jgi:hypothetical protein
MIDIPEERILKEITDILMNDLPKVLLEYEEQSEDSIRLPPFRYVGLEENLPPGTGLPYAFVEIEEGEYTEKDRIIKRENYRISIKIHIRDYTSGIFYYHAINIGFTSKIVGFKVRARTNKLKDGIFSFIIIK